MSKYGKDHELYRRINEYWAQRNFQPSEFQRPEVRSTSVYTFSACKQTQYSFNLYNKGDLDYSVSSEEPLNRKAVLQGRTPTAQNIAM